eukprot:scpid47926/ scgid26273/ Protein FAM160B1
MFGRLASFVQQAAEVLAPSAPLQDDFIHHWKAVTHQLLAPRDEHQPVEATNVPDHLTNMVELLNQEEMESDGTTGPCMEYLLQHKILETLLALGRADSPPGMKQQVLKFFTSVIGRAQQPLLPHIHVHKPVLRLIHCCAESRASPTEGDEVHFLCTVASSLQRHPHLANVFLEQRPTSTAAEPTSAASTKSPRPQAYTIDPDHSKFHLLAALLELSKSEDRRVSLKACEGMLLCASLDNESTARSIANNSPFCQILADRVQSTFASIPLDLPAQKVLSCSAKWGMEGGTDEEPAYEGRTELRAWLSCLDYFDRLVLSSHSIIASALLQSLDERFFKPQLQPRLAQMSEHGLVVTTCLVTKLVEVVTAPLLVHGLILLLIGPGSQSDSDSDSVDQVELCQHLISRCDHVNEELSLVSLQLFNLLLQKNDPLVIHRLVLHYLADDLHLKPEARENGGDQRGTAESTRPASGDGAGEGQNSTLTPGAHVSALAEQADSAAASESESQSGTQSPGDLSSQVSSSSVDSSRPETPSSENRPAESLLATSSTTASAEQPNTPTSPAPVPLTPTTPGAPTASAPQSLTFSSGGASSAAKGRVASPSSDIEPLVQQLFAERNHSELIINTILTMLPETVKTSLHMPTSGYDEYVRDAQNQVARCFTACQKWSSTPLYISPEHGQFTEGPFLRLLFNKLQRSLDQPYEINLTVTGLLTRLAYFPHRNLHAYLLDPFIPLSDNVRSLHSVLRQISAELSIRAQRTPDFQGNVLAARKRLSGTSNFETATSQTNHLYEAVVVLEEFCKELAAIAFVKSAAYLQQCSLA